jgi:hypothetical protein
MLPLDQAEDAEKDTGVRDGITDDCACTCGHRPRRGLPRPV